MIPPAPSKILIGISLDPDHSIELLSWATRVLAQSNDTIVAIHVLVGKESKKRELIKKKQWQIRQAKAHVISVLGEFARTCQSKQINLEARVGFSSDIARVLIEEAKSISADYLLLRGSRNRSNRTWHEVIRYCFEHAPETCTVLSLGKCEPQKNAATIKAENLQPSSWWLSKNDDGNTRSGSTSSTIENLINSETKRQNSSPRTVLHQIEAESHSTEDDTLSFGDSSTTESPPLATNINGRSKTKKQISNCKLISSLFASPMRKRNRIFLNKEKQQPLLKCFTFEEIANATNNFHPDKIVGRGGYSEVYRGDLSDGRAIAVKMLAKDNKDASKEKEFLMELGIIGHVCHPNTANLLGCCIENGLYLIFNFSQNGNLASALHGKTGESLQWPIRYKIALGVARGLHYLHKCCKHRIIHRDIKASNVLLGPDYEPQITDFGLAKWLPNKMTHHAVIPIEGTFGYIAPEYFMHGIVDEKTDVFAFGVLLLEIITGRRPVDSSKQNLLLWAKPLMESGNITELADPKLEGKFDSDQVHRVVLTASYCVRESSTWRPSMSEVLELLTSGHDSEVARSWRMPKFTSDELDDYSMIFGYEVPVDIALEDYL
ncbi:PREDICTED: probable receptor-like serine/threonine-protein kinase At5g57670 isoform X1 [Populus euphratica]|uniref:Probable receptor-like serine/threonine-protein kinase At5g57670 isoform X1 n=1 Tax=Populus euphratica TaxID=75702 RepID=A0AAJ6TJX0_POPEU|nr:PREDICTED: probable receptor-like serine/threonine-protein kinase At5g57670 isoform X1 [Populus euphratica]